MYEIDYDSETDAWTITHTDLKLLDFDAVKQWETFMLEEVAPRFGGKKVDLLIDLSGIEIGPRVAEHYGAFVRAFVKEHTHEVFRFGPPLGLTESVIKLQAVIQHFSANIYEDRAAALRALELVRSKTDPQGRSIRTEDPA